jgi:Xaa-Pro aminopeptidase
MTLPVTQLRIPDAEFKSRAAKLLDHVRALDARGVVLFDRDYILYYTGFAFIPTERPVAFVMNLKGERGLFVPRLELEHAQANALIERVDHYIEYPHDPHPMDKLRQMLFEMGVREHIAVDDDGYPWILGYRGAALSTLTGARITHTRAFIEDAMMIKSPAEAALIRESCKWGNLAHVLLQRYTHIGATETEVSDRASREATYAMYDALGVLYRAQAGLGMGRGAFAGYRGQIGRNSAIPHALPNNITFQAGDVLVTGAASTIWGYGSELERTMFMGKPNDEARRLYDHMMALQELAFETIRAGVPCSEVDVKARAYYEQHDLMGYWKHHVGHAIGIRYHEAPFLDIGDKTIIQPGMVFTVEPGLYAPGIGGFRHSDTVLVTDDGIELLTYYPRDVESMTISV